MSQGRADGLFATHKQGN